MTVGWGSKETQFQGVAGRKNREKIDVNKVPVAVAESERIKEEVLVSWRADAQFFTVSSVDEVEAGGADGGDSGNTVLCRQLRVWNRELELLSKCEFLAGQEGVLCMR